jgi:hypothetical protein
MIKDDCSGYRNCVGGFCEGESKCATPSMCSLDENLSGSRCNPALGG